MKRISSVRGQAMVETLLLITWVMILIFLLIEIFSLMVNIFIAMDVSHTTLRKTMVSDTEAAKNSVLVYPVISFFGIPGKVNIDEDPQRKILSVENEYIHLGIISLSHIKRFKIVNKTVKSPEKEFYEKSYPQGK